MDEAARVKTMDGSVPGENIAIFRNAYDGSTLLRKYVLRKLLNDPWRQAGAVVLEDELPNVRVQELHDLNVETTMHESAEAVHCKDYISKTILFQHARASL